MTQILAGLVRGFGLVALAIAIGGLVLEQLILPAGSPELADARARLRRLITGCLAFLILTTIADLVMRAQLMSRAPLDVVIAGLPEVVRSTHLGVVLAGRAGALVLAWFLSRATVPALRILCLAIGIGIALTFSLTGHAADWGDLTDNVVADWMHAAAASVWTGGVIALAVSVLPADSAMPTPILGVVARRFSVLAGYCLLAVVATGIYSAWWQLDTVSRLGTTTYGRVLLVKVAMALTMVWLGAMNRYLVVPSLASGGAPGLDARLFRIACLALRGPRRGGSAAAPARFSAYIAAEALIAIGVFACVAVLTETTPGRHVVVERKPGSHVTNIAPSAGRVSPTPSGIVVPPPGDVARGRSVFVKLHCFTCHAVPGQQEPAPSRPGPNLTGVGRNHPGYLVESIVNPNARIVDGPGYTDSNGLSTMPDYREQLKVDELIDLVAYLRSLDK